MNAEAEEHWRAVKRRDVPAIVRLHATTGFRAKWGFQFGFFGRGFQTFGLFLLGLWAGRRRLFEDVEAHRRLFGQALALDGGAHLAPPAGRRRSLRGGRATRGGQPQQPAGTLPDFSSWPVVAGLGLFDAWNNAMTLFYVASFALLFLRPRWQPRLLRFGPVGRMALSAYVGPDRDWRALIFFGFGLGLLGRFGNTVTIPMGLGRVRRAGLGF